MSAAPACKPFPTSELARLERRGPGEHETWSKYWGGAFVPAKTLAGGDYSNWDNFAPLTGVGGGFCSGVKDDCNQPMFSRIGIGVSSLLAAGMQPSDSVSVPPPIHLEIRVGFGCAVSRVARIIWTPQSWTDSGYLTQVTDLLATQAEIWGWCEIVDDVKIDLKLGIHMGVDRIGGGAVSNAPLPSITPSPMFLNPTLGNVDEDKT